MYIRFLKIYENKFPFTVLINSLNTICIYYSIYSASCKRVFVFSSSGKLIEKRI